jgi:hypothetical protein
MTQTFKIGDRVRVKANQTMLTPGREGTVTETWDDSLNIRWDGDTASTGGYYTHRFEKIEETPVTNAVPVAKPAPALPFAIGDKVRYTNKLNGAEKGLVLGREYTVDGIVRGGWVINLKELPDQRFNHRRFTKVEQPQAVEAPKVEQPNTPIYRKGDKVECLLDTSAFTKGKIYEVREDFYGRPYESVKTTLDDDGSTTNGWVARCFRPAPAPTKGRFMVLFRSMTPTDPLHGCVYTSSFDGVEHDTMEGALKVARETVDAGRDNDTYVVWQAVKVIKAKKTVEIIEEAA